MPFCNISYFVSVTVNLLGLARMIWAKEYIYFKYQLYKFNWLHNRNETLFRKWGFSWLPVLLWNQFNNSLHLDNVCSLSHQDSTLGVCCKKLFFVFNPRIAKLGYCVCHLPCSHQPTTTSSNLLYLLLRPHQDPTYPYPSYYHASHTAWWGA